MNIEKPTPDAVECRELRSCNSKTFQLPSGLMQCEVRRDAVCYTSDEGVLRSCDTTVKQADGRVFVEWLPYKFELHNSGVGFDFQSREAGFVRISLAAVGGEEFDTKSQLKPTVDGDTITFEDVRPGVDIVFKILPMRVKTLRIVKDEKAARTFEWMCEHDADGRDKVDDTLTGVDASGRRLDLKSEIAPVDDMSFRMRESWSGFTKLRDPKTRIPSLSSQVEYPVEIDPTVNNGIATTNDDGSSFSSGVWYPNYNVYFGHHNANNRDYNPGWSFAGVSVPQGSTITSATLTIKSLNDSDGTAKLYCEAADNPATFSNSRLPETITKTVTFVSNSVTPRASNVFDVTAPVQSVVSRAGWVSGNRMNIVGIGQTIGGSPGFALLRDYHNNAAESGKLSITYTAGGGGGGTVGRIVTINQAVRRASTF